MTSKALFSDFYQGMGSICNYILTLEQELASEEPTSTQNTKIQKHLSEFKWILETGINLKEKFLEPFATTVDPFMDK